MSNPFKNMNVYRLKQTGGVNVRLFADIMDNIDDFEALVEKKNAESGDPSGGQWSRTGFAHAYEGSYFHNLDGAGFLFALQFNERILPGKVRDEKVKEAVAALAEKQGHAVNKKDYAQLREQVEFDLLPQAFIRRTLVYAVITPEDHLFVFTSSAKKADAVLFHLIGLVSENGVETSATPLKVKNPMKGWLNSVARDEPGSDEPFHPYRSAVLKGEEKRTIRVKDRDIAAHEIQKLIVADYDVSELGIYWLTTEIDPDMTFVLTDQLIFKKIEISNVILTATTDKGDDGKIAFHSFAYIVTRKLRDLVAALTADLGGEAADVPTDPEDDGEI